MTKSVAPRPGARVILPLNYWNNGEFRDQLNLDTMQYRTLAEMFREDVGTPKAKQRLNLSQPLNLKPPNSPLTS